MSCTACNENLIALDDHILSSLKSCAMCEMLHLRECHERRLAGSLDGVLDDDSLGAVLLMAACSNSSRSSHSVALLLATVSRRFLSLVHARLWKPLCELEASERLLMSQLNGCNTDPRKSPTHCPMPMCLESADDILASLQLRTPLLSKWRMLHRNLTVPIRFRSRTYKSWRLDTRLRKLNLDSPTVLHLDAKAPTRLSPGYGYTRWAGADQLLRPKVRELIRRELDPLASKQQQQQPPPRVGESAPVGWRDFEEAILTWSDGSSDEEEEEAAEAAGTSQGGGIIGDNPSPPEGLHAEPSSHSGGPGGSHAGPPVPRASSAGTPSSASASVAPALHCVLREASPSHLLLQGIFTLLTPAARQALRRLAPATAPTLTQRDGSGGGSSRARPPPTQRCLCCAALLRPSRRHSGAVCRRACGLPLWMPPPPVMRDATSWFKSEVERWVPESGCHARASAADDGALPTADFACLDSALVCPNGHCVLVYELYEGEGDATEDSEEEEEEEEEEDLVDDFEWLSDWDGEEEEDEEEEDEDDDSDASYGFDFEDSDTTSSDSESDHRQSRLGRRCGVSGQQVRVRLAHGLGSGRMDATFDY